MSEFWGKGYVHFHDWRKRSCFYRNITFCLSFNMNTLIETEQNPEGPSQVQSPSVPHFLLMEKKSFSFLGLS